MPAPHSLFDTMRYRSSRTVQISGYFHSSVSYIKVQIIFKKIMCILFYLFYFSFGVYVTFDTVQVISRPVVGRAEETSTYSLLGFCTVIC